MNKLGKILILCLVVLILTTCGPALPALSIPSETVNPTPTGTEIPPATATDLPTRTPYPTIDATAIAAEFSDWPEEKTSINRSVSPDGRWEAVVTDKFDLHRNGDDFDYAFVELRVTSANGNIEYIPYSLVYRYGLGGETVLVVKWSEASDRMFFSRYIFVDGHGDFPFYRGLFSVDLDDGSTSTLVEDLAGDFEFSQNSEELVYFRANQDGYEVIRRSLLDSLSESVQLDMPCSEQGGGIVWSPDESQVAFNILQGSCEGSEDGLAIVVVSLSDMSYEVIYQSYDLMLFTVGWKTDGLLVESRYTGEDMQWLMNPQTGELTPVP